MSSGNAFGVCGLCETKQTRPMEHICEMEGCTSPICNRCWNVFQKRHCLEHSQSNTAFSRSSRAGNLTFFQNFKNQEDVFLERIRAQFSDLNVLYHPLTEEPVSLGKSWEFVGESGEAGWISARLPLDQRKIVPLNRSVTYAINFPNRCDILPRNLRGVFVEAKYWFNWDMFFLKREWNIPRSKMELLSFLAGQLKSWQKKESCLVLALFSPSGWEGESIQSIEGKDRFVSPNLITVLVSDEGVYFDRKNPLAVFLAPIFERELLRDRRKNCEQAIENSLIGVHHVSLEGLTQDLSYPKSLIREVMVEMAKNSDKLIFESRGDVGDILRRRM
jgi:hypothetical protein